MQGRATRKARRIKRSYTKTSGIPLSLNCSWSFRLSCWRSPSLPGTPILKVSLRLDGTGSLPGYLVLPWPHCSLGFLGPPGTPGAPRVPRYPRAPRDPRDLRAPPSQAESPQGPPRDPRAPREISGAPCALLGEISLS